MPISNRNKKRIGFFSLVPLFTTILIVVDDLTIRIITGAILVTYVGFIIFLRDSLKEEGFDQVEEKLNRDQVTVKAEKFLDEDGKFDSGDEGFEIVGKTSSTVDAMNIPSSNLEEEEKVLTPEAINIYKEIISDKLPEDVGDDEEFEALLKKILHVIRDSLAVHSALFYIYNPNTEKISLRDFISRSNDLTARKFDLQNDVLSRIVKEKEPQILLNISSVSEADNIRYYSHPQGIKSFCGVPYEYTDKLILILAVDSKSPEEFGIETTYILGRYIRIIATLVSLFEERHSESVNENRLKALLKSVSLQRNFKNVKELGNYISTVVDGMVEWDFFTFIMFDVSEKKYKISNVAIKNGSLKYVGENLEIDEKNSIVGKVLKTGDHVYVPDISAVDAPRFSSSEDITQDGSFLAVPLIYESHSFGIITFELLRKDKYTSGDIVFLKKVFHLFAYYIQCYSSQKFLQSLISVDVETGVLNKTEFLKQLSIELKKDKLMKTEGALVLIKIDNFMDEDSLFEKGFVTKVIRLISQMIVKQLSELNIIGRLHERVFGIYFYNSELNDVTVWAQKLRTLIARESLPVISKQKNYTVSIGIVSTKEKENIKDIIADAELALSKAVKSGGNKVVS